MTSTARLAEPISTSHCREQLISPNWRSAPVTITAPFLASGVFHGETSPSSQFDVAIRGGGTITVNLSPDPLGHGPRGTFRYDFVVMPTPEPATLTMEVAASSVRGSASG